MVISLSKYSLLLLHLSKQYDEIFVM